MGDVQVRSTGVVIPFPPAAARPSRPTPRADERRGEILLFTGIRYEWPMGRGEPLAPMASGDSPHAGRPNRRS